MNIKLLNHTDNKNALINRRIADLTLNQYQKGLQKKNDELTSEATNNDELDTVKPIDNIKVKKSYKANRTVVPITSKPNKSRVKEFILESNKLDNELEQMITHMKITNKDEFYGQGMSGGALPSDYETKYNHYRAEILRLIGKLPIDVVGQAFQVEKRTSKQTLRNLFNNYLAPYTDADDASDEEIESQLYMLEFYYDELKQYEEALSQPMTESLKPYLNRKNEPNNFDIKNIINRGNKKDLDIDKVKEWLKENKTPAHRERSNAPGKLHELKQQSMEKMLHDTLLTTSNRKSKRGIKIINDIEVNKFATTEIPLIAKKLTNIITTLLPMAQNLYDDHFNTSTHDDNNKLLKLYEDMDEKIYILTSLNSQSSQLKKLDEQFDKLKNYVVSGISHYTPLTGGDILHTHSNHLYQPKQKPLTNHLYYL